MGEVCLVRIGSVSRSTLKFLSAVLEDSLSLSCRIHPAAIEAGRAFDPTRRQYGAPALLEELSRLPGVSGGPSVKVLGVADVDLFIPILTFVFGQAQLSERTAVLSVLRLREEFYGLPANEARFLDRCEKEAIHELGHTFGLIHCPFYDCAMHFSNSVEEIDLKSNGLCRRCSKLFRERRR